MSSPSRSSASSPLSVSSADLEMVDTMSVHSLDSVSTAVEFEVEVKAPECSPLLQMTTVITNFKEYYESVGIYETSCFARRKEMERLRKENEQLKMQNFEQNNQIAQLQNMCIQMKVSVSSEFWTQQGQIEQQNYELMARNGQIKALQTELRHLYFEKIDELRAKDAEIAEQKTQMMTQNEQIQKLHEDLERANMQKDEEGEVFLKQQQIKKLQKELEKCRDTMRKTGEKDVKIRRLEKRLEAWKRMACEQDSEVSLKEQVIRRLRSDLKRSKEQKKVVVEELEEQKERVKGLKATVYEKECELEIAEFRRIEQKSELWDQQVIIRKLKMDANCLGIPLPCTSKSDDDLPKKPDPMARVHWLMEQVIDEISERRKRRKEEGKVDEEGKEAVDAFDNMLMRAYWHLKIETMRGN